MSDDLRLYLKKADEYLSSAKLLVQTEYLNGAITDSYYTFFWIVRGLLYEKGIVTKRHSGLRDMFGLHFIKTGELPLQYRQDLDLLFDRRQLIDYDVDGEFPIEEISLCISKAENFLSFIRGKYA